MMICVGMIVRHADYYFFGPVIYEFGHLQSFLGKLLIPVTASFGLSFWVGRDKLYVNQAFLIRLGVVFLIPFALFIFQEKEILNIFDYKVASYVDRPQFIILVPIVLSIFLILVFQNSSKLLQFCVFVICYFCYLVSHSFVLHYISLFLLGKLILSKVLNNKQTFLKLISSIFILILSGGFIDFFEIRRIDFFWELVLALSYIFILKFIAEKTSKLGIKFFGFSVLYFYIAQACIFNLFNHLEFSGIIALILVACMSFLISFSIKKFEKIIVS